MTMIVIMLGIFVMVAATCIGVLALVSSAVKALAGLNPTVKVVQEYGVIDGPFSDIYDTKGDLKDAEEKEVTNFDDILKEFNDLFADDEVKSDG